MKIARTLATTLFSTITLTAPIIAVSAEAEDPTTDATTATLLFVQSANGISYDSAKGTLTLEGVSPVVTFFTDRPKRMAGHVLLPGFLKVWDEGRDSFKKDPPNAALSILDNGNIKSAVVTLSDPQVSKDRLTYQVKVLQGDLPATGGASSLFIDGLFFGGGPLLGGAAGAGLGAIGGALAGNAGKGAAIGAAVGVVGGLLNRERERAAAQQAATTRVINVPNKNGSYTPVALRLVPGGWQGPRGEIYPTFPSIGQLQQVY